MTIGEILKHKNVDTYRRLNNMFKPKKIIGIDMDDLEESKKYSPKEIELGCSVKELMKSDSYCREGRRIKQRSWG